MTEEKLKEKEEALKLKEKALNDAIKAYTIARINEEEAKEKYDEWVFKMYRAHILAGISFGITIALLSFNLARLFL